MYLLLVILAGEAIFILPFVLVRVFRPTVLEVFNLSNFQIGTCQSVYGMVALLAYLLGGPIADRYPPRKLIALALWTTAIGGVFFASYPSYQNLKILYGYWGITTIFLFWAPMIKATRIWGGDDSQGKAFGLLDGGRGIVGALFGLLGVFIFSIVIGNASELTNHWDQKEAFKMVILVSSLLVFLIGVFVWFFLKSKGVTGTIYNQKITLKHIKKVLSIPSVWLLMVIILCAYVGYKITDVFSLYASDIMKYNDVDAAKTGTFLLFIRPFVGLTIGFIADKSTISRWLTISFALSMVGAIIFASGMIQPNLNFLFFLSVIVTACGIYAVRSLYFATLKEGNIPLILTGTAVGIISLIGYTPDIFAGPSMGYLLDQDPGLVGHQNVFLMLLCFSSVGCIASFLFHKMNKKQKSPI